MLVIELYIPLSLLYSMQLSFPAQSFPFTELPVQFSRPVSNLLPRESLAFWYRAQIPKENKVRGIVNAQKTQK